jgi:hypothetical protein
MKQVFLHFTSEIFAKFFPKIFEQRFDVVDLQKALAESECEIWINLADIGLSFTQFGGFPALVAIKNKNPRIKIYDVFGREGSDGDALDFGKLLETFPSR